jgi:hypothetical protein
MVSLLKINSQLSRPAEFPRQAIRSKRTLRRVRQSRRLLLPAQTIKIFFISVSLAVGNRRAHRPAPESMPSDREIRNQ